MSFQSAVYGFVPTSVTGCLLWLDGADTSSSSMTLTGNTVNTWKDKSGNGYNYTQTSYSTTLPPLSNIKTGTGVYFGSQQGLYNTSFPFPTSYTIFSVANQTTNYGGYQYILHSPYNADYIIFFGSLNGNFATFTGSGGWNDVNANSPSSSIATTSNTASILCCTNNGTTLTPYFNSVAMSTKTGTNAAATGMTLGDTDTAHPRQPWLGTVGEIIIFNSVLGTTQRQQVEGYLAQKWGLTDSLPASHPGRSTTFYRSDYTKQNVMTARPYYVAFSPRLISGCALWLDGADPAGNGVVPANGATVSTWVDKSGNANNGTSGTATFNRDSVGGFINFTGGQTYSITNPNVVVNQYFTIFVVEQLQNYSGGESAFMGGNGSFNANLHMRYTTGGGGMKFGFFGNDLDASVTAFLTNSTQPVRIWSFSFLPSSRVIYLNGTSIGSDSNNTQLSGWGGAAIGAMVSYGGQYYNGKMREVMIFSGSLLTAQRQQVESYLAQKWGLTASLPGGHSHATQPAGAITRTALANLRLVVQPRRYTSFRWTITAGTTDGLIQFSEFQVGFNNTQLVFASPTTATTGSTISWNTGAGEGPAQAVDNNLNTKGLGIGTSGLVLIVTVATPIAANMYRWATANDVTPGRNPTQWTVDGSADGTTFVRLHTQNTTYASPNSIFTFTSWIPFTYS